MQKLAVVYFPKANIDTIDSFRKKYDPGWKIIPSHITIVSPLSDISESQLVEHVETMTKDIKTFPIRLNGLTRKSDDCLFLLVKEGNDEIVTLHDKLYSGMLAPYLPTNFPFVPHITLGYVKTEIPDVHFVITCDFDAVSVIKGDGRNLAKIVKTINFQKHK